MKLFKQAYFFYVSFLQMLIGRKRSVEFDSSFQKILLISFFGAGVTCILSVAFMGCCVILLNVIHYPKPTEEVGAVVKHIHPAKDCAKDNLYLLFLYSCFLAPIFEEICFRLLLIYSKINFVVALSVYAIFGGFVSQNGLCRLINGTYFDFNYKIQLLFLIIAFISLILLNIKAVDDIFKLLFNKHWLWFFYIMALFFGSLHTWPPFSIVSNWPWIIVQGAPQIFDGLYSGYIRIGYGLKWSIATHMVWNICIFFLSMIFG